MLVLKGIGLSVEEGEAVCVIGANGAGKTTLLHSITGIKPVKSGEILFHGRQIHQLSPVQIVRSGISLVPEGRKIFAPLTVRENLMMGGYLKIKQGGKGVIEKDLDYVTKIFPILREREKQLGGELSGGEQQMLSIARALISQPKLLLLDEPSMGIAPIIVKEIFNVLQGLKAQRTTLLLVEQNSRIALKLSDRGYVLERGKVVAEGSREKLMGDEAIKKAYLGT